MKKFISILLILASLFTLTVLTSCTDTKAPTADEAGTTAADTTAADTIAEDTTAASDFEAVKADGKMIIGITEYEPMNYQDENGEWTGFDTEFAKAVAEKLGMTAEFIVIEWDNKVFELESGSIDCVWNGMTLNDSVRESMDCSQAYVINAQVVVMAKDRLDSFADAASMADLQFAVESGSAGQELAEANNFKFTGVTAQSDALLEVSSGSADACIIDITMANAMTGEGTSYADLGYAVSLSEEEYGIGFRKGSDMVAKVDEVITAMKSDGTLKALADKYELTLAD